MWILWVIEIERGFTGTQSWLGYRWSGWLRWEDYYDPAASGDIYNWPASGPATPPSSMVRHNQTYQTTLIFHCHRGPQTRGGKRQELANYLEKITFSWWSFTVFPGVQSKQWIPDDRLQHSYFSPTSQPVSLQQTEPRCRFHCSSDNLQIWKTCSNFKPSEKTFYVKWPGDDGVMGLQSFLIEYIPNINIE